MDITGFRKESWHASYCMDNEECNPEVVSNVRLKATKGAAVPAGPAQAWINTVHKKESSDTRSACKKMNAITSAVGNLKRSVAASPLTSSGSCTARTPATTCCEGR